MTFAGVCARCKATITADVTMESTGEAAVSPPPVMGSYCDCGERKSPGGLDGAQAVPLTLREVV